VDARLYEGKGHHDEVECQKDSSQEDYEDGVDTAVDSAVEGLQALFVLDESVVREEEEGEHAERRIQQDYSAIVLVKFVDGGRLYDVKVVDAFAH